MKKSFIIHPFLFAIHPLLFLFSHNIKELRFSVIFVPSIIVLILTVLALLLLGLIFKNYQKAGILVSISWILFFSYGHFYNNILRDIYFSVNGFNIGSNKMIAFGSFLIFLITFYAIRINKNLHIFTNVLNIVASSLVLFSLFNIGLYQLTGWNSEEGRRRTETIEDLDKPVKLPNIYYITLDAYANGEILKEMYHFDNTKLINYLTQKGFYIADKSMSNYHITAHSQESSFNFEYLNDPTPKRNRFLDNRVFDLLKKLGYTTVVLTSWYEDLDILKADWHLTYTEWGAFQNQLINYTPIPILVRKLNIELGNQYSIHREKIQFIFDTLKDTTKWRALFIVYAHVVIPHPPFVFGPDGEKIQSNRRFGLYDAKDFFTAGGTRDEYVNGYKGQVEYANKRVIALIDYLLSATKEPPIIILQADHGPRLMSDWSDLNKTYLKECFSILNAYYFPGKSTKDLYRSISPVNSFRVIFNLYFHTNYPLLKDKYHFLDQKNSKFIDVTDRVNASVQ
jgi:hypothetical protein